MPSIWQRDARLGGGVLGESEVDIAVGRGGEEKQPVETGLLNSLGVQRVSLLPCLLPMPRLVDLLSEVRRLAVLAGGCDLVDDVCGWDNGDDGPEEVLQSLKSDN